MLRRKFILQVSLRSLFLATAIVAALTQATLAARRQQLDARRDAFVTNFHEQLVTSRHMRSRLHSERYLQYVERTIEAEYVESLPRAEKRRLLQLVSAERNYICQTVPAN